MKKIIISVCLIFVLNVLTFAQNRSVTILYTNDFHSAFDPIPAYWLKGSPKLGGAAQLTTYINQIRPEKKRLFYLIRAICSRGRCRF